MPLNVPNYYDDQFNRKINEIAKPVATPSSANAGTSGGGGWGFRGAGVIIGILAFVVLRVLLFSGSSSNYSPPTFQYTPPPTITLPNHRIDFPPPDRFQDQPWNENAKDQPLRRDWKQPDFDEKK
jgi:hypothetical protein